MSIALLKNINDIHIKKYYIDQLIELDIKNIITITETIANLIKKELSKNGYNVNDYYSHFHSIWSTSYQLFTFPLYQEVIYDESYLSLYNINLPLTQFTIAAYLDTICAQYMIMKTSEHNKINFIAYRGIVEDTHFDDIEYNQTIFLNEIEHIPKSEHISEHIRGFLKLYYTQYKHPYDDLNLDLEKYSDYDYYYSKLVQNFKININDHSYVRRLKNIIKNPIQYKVPSKIKIPTQIEVPNYTDSKFQDWIKFYSGTDTLNHTIDEWISLYINDTIDNMIDAWITLHKSINKFKNVGVHLKSYHKYAQNNNTICEIPLRSFTIDKTVTDRFTKKNTCCLIQANINPNTPYLWIGGLGEREIIFPLFAEFSVKTIDETNVNLEYNGSNFHITEEEFYLHLQYYIDFCKEMLDEDRLRKNNKELYLEIMNQKEKFITKCKRYHDEFNKKYNVIL